MREGQVERMMENKVRVKREEEGVREIMGGE